MSSPPDHEPKKAETPSAVSLVGSLPVRHLTQCVAHRRTWRPCFSGGIPSRPNVNVAVPTRGIWTVRSKCRSDPISPLPLPWLTPFLPSPSSFLPVLSHPLCSPLPFSPSPSCPSLSLSPSHTVSSLAPPTPTN